jgi:uncharacterized protein (DUF4415 family)
MSANKKSISSDWVDPDDAPDLSHPEWVEKFATVKSVRGRPRVQTPKTAISIRLSQDVVERFRATGAGWQTRMDQALKEWLKTNAPE